jgi:hypothetical protein
MDIVLSRCLICSGVGQIAGGAGVAGILAVSYRAVDAGALRAGVSLRDFCGALYER